MEDSKICPVCFIKFNKPCGYGNVKWRQRVTCSNPCSSVLRMRKQPLQKETIGGDKIGNAGIDLTGKQFGRLTVLYLHSRSRNGQIRWYCKCECGTEKDILGTHLISGKIISCGKHIKRNKDRKDWKGHEGISGQFWSQIKRGANGEKGRNKIPFNLTIEQAWELYLKQNRQCALSGLPIEFPEKWDAKRTASLDRIDSGGNYEISNVQWVHKDINKMKNSFDQKYFIRLCKIIANYR